MLAYIGCRTTLRRKARGKGISVYRVDDTAQQWEQIQLLEGLTNPSYLVLNRDGDRLYCIHGDRSEISAFAIHPVSGEIKLLNQMSTGGANPVHLALDPSERFIVVSNHISSSLAVIGLAADGTLTGVTDFIELSGTLGPHRIEQPFPKPHANPFTPDGRHVMVPDKGLDCLFAIPFDGHRGKFQPPQMVKTPTREGAGPRHIDFHPELNIAYVINELDSTVATYQVDYASGEMTPLQILPSVSPLYTGNNRAAGVVVHPSGRHVLTSNRGEDSVAVFEVNPRSGHLAYIRSFPSGGKTPRFLGFDCGPGHLHIANEDDDTVATFDITTILSRQPAPLHQLTTPSPVCLAFRED